MTTESNDCQVGHQDLVLILPTYRKIEGLLLLASAYQTWNTCVLVCCLHKMSMETPHPESTVGKMRWHWQTQHECGTIIHSDLCIKNQPAKISDSVSHSVSAVASQFHHHKFKSSCNNVLIGEHGYIQTKHNLVTANIEFLVIFLCLFMILLLIFHKYVNFF